MFINRFFAYVALGFLVAGCGVSPRDTDWSQMYGTEIVGAPSQLQYGGFAAHDDATHRIAVLLPLSGDAAPVGQSIRTSVEMAVLQSAPKTLSVAFYDANMPDAMQSAIAENPDIFIGPVFSENARALRAAKPDTTPALAFTSDAQSIGSGVMTMALMPSDSIEAISTEMASDNAKKMIIIAPETESGRLMAGAATESGENNNIETVGIFFYTPGDTESIRLAAIDASMNTARVAANNRAREILSDILTNEKLNQLEKSSLTAQLEKISKSDTLGPVPYDAVLYLGDGADTTSMASFLRYYGVSNHDARFYGTAMWDGSNIASDITMIGAKYAAMQPISPAFAETYERISGAAPSHLAAFGYDATNMAMGMIYSGATPAAYLLDPSGYVGTDGLFRLRPNGNSQRALNIYKLNGSGVPSVAGTAPRNFINPIYNIDVRRISPAKKMDIESDGINPMDYILIPNNLHGKYKSKTYGKHKTVAPQTPEPTQPVILPEDDSESVATPDFESARPESVAREYIDSVEISE